MVREVSSQPGIYFGSNPQEDAAKSADSIHCYFGRRDLGQTSFTPHNTPDNSEIKEMLAELKQRKNAYNKKWSTIEVPTEFGKCVLGVKENTPLIYFELNSQLFPDTVLSAFKAKILEHFSQQLSNVARDNWHSAFKQAVEMTYEMIYKQSHSGFPISGTHFLPVSDTSFVTSTKSNPTTIAHQSPHQIPKNVLEALKENAIEVGTKCVESSLKSEKSDLPYVKEIIEKNKQNINDALEKLTETRQALKTAEKELSRFQRDFDTARRKGKLKFKTKVNGKKVKINLEKAKKHEKHLKAKIAKKNIDLIKESAKLQTAQIFQSGLKAINDNASSDLGNNIGEKAASLLFHAEEFENLMTLAEELAQETSTKLVERSYKEMCYHIVKELATKISPAFGAKLPYLHTTQVAINLLQASLKAKSAEELFQKVGLAGLEATVQIALYAALSSVCPSLIVVAGIQGFLNEFTKEFLEDMRTRGLAEPAIPDDKPTDFILTTPSSAPAMNSGEDSTSSKNEFSAATTSAPASVSAGTGLIHSESFSQAPLRVPATNQTKKQEIPSFFPSSKVPGISATPFQASHPLNTLENTLSRSQIPQTHAPLRNPALKTERKKEASTNSSAKKVSNKHSKVSTNNAAGHIAQAALKKPAVPIQTSQKQTKQISAVKVTKLPTPPTPEVAQPLTVPAPHNKAMENKISDSIFTPQKRVAPQTTPAPYNHHAQQPKPHQEPHKSPHSQRPKTQAPKPSNFFDVLGTFTDLKTGLEHEITDVLLCKSNNPQKNKSHEKQKGLAATSGPNDSVSRPKQSIPSDNMRPSQAAQNPENRKPNSSHPDNQDNRPSQGTKPSEEKSDKPNSTPLSSFQKTAKPPSGLERDMAKLKAPFLKAADNVSSFGEGMIRDSANRKGPAAERKTVFGKSIKKGGEEARNQINNFGTTGLNCAGNVCADALANITEYDGIDDLLMDVAPKIISGTGSQMATNITYSVVEEAAKNVQVLGKNIPIPALDECLLVFQLGNMVCRDPGISKDNQISSIEQVYARATAAHVNQAFQKVIPIPIPPAVGKLMENITVNITVNQDKIMSEAGALVFDATVCMVAQAAIPIPFVGAFVGKAVATGTRYGVRKAWNWFNNKT